MLKQILNIKQQSKFKDMYSKEQRISIYNTLVQKNLKENNKNPNDHVLIVIQPYIKLFEKIDNQNPNKVQCYKHYMINGKVKVSSLLQQIKKSEKLNKTEMISLSCGDLILNVDNQLKQVYTKFKDPEDNFLYIQYRIGQVF